MPNLFGTSVLEHYFGCFGVQKTRNAGAQRATELYRDPSAFFTQEDGRSDEYDICIRPEAVA